MAAVPRALWIGDVAFPLRASVTGVMIDYERRGLNALSYLVGHLTVERRGAARLRELVEGRDITVPQALYASRFEPGDTALDYGDSVINWMRLGGRRLDVTGAYRIGTTFLDERLALPCAVFRELVEEVGRLHDGVVAGTIDGALEGRELVPVAPPPEVVEYDRLAAISSRFALEYVAQLFGLRER